MWYIKIKLQKHMEEQVLDATQEQHTINESEAQATQNVEEAAATPTGETANLSASEADLEALKAELEAERQKYLYKVAEFENFRKRTLKEKTELILSGGKKLMEAMLPVIDDLERAEANIAKAESVEALKEGLELILGKLHKTLAEQGLKVIETEGQVFDTDYHEAIAMVPAPSEELKGKILDCVSKGYMLNDSVLRHARVAVGQ